MLIVLDSVKFLIPAKMPQRNLAVALLYQLKSQLPSTSHCQIVDVTGVQKPTLMDVIQQQEKL
jgi:hypothetical protein